MADFPEEGAPIPQGGRQHTILPKIPKNCMKLKEFGPPGGGARIQNFTMCHGFVSAGDALGREHSAAPMSSFFAGHSGCKVT